MNDRRISQQYQSVQSPSGYSYESCATPMFDMAWGHQAQQLQQQQQQQPPHTPRHDDTLSDFFADPDFRWIANTIFTPPRPSRGATFDPLASPASPGNWMLSIPPINSNMPFSPAQAVSEMHSRTQQRPAQSRPIISSSMPSDMRHSTEADLMMACQMPEQRDTFTRSASLNYAPQADMSNSPELFQTPLNQQRQLSGSLSDLGQYVASSASRPTAPVNALHGTRASVDPRGTAMRRASNRIPKRSLEPHFEMSHSVPNPKGRAARRGPIGSSKAHKPSDTGTGEVSKGARGGSQAGSSSSICGLMSPFSLLKPFGRNGQGSLAELNKRIQESAEKPQPTSSSDNSDAGSSGQAGSITMNRLAKGVPVGASPTKL